MFQFMDAFRGLARVFPLRGDDHDITQVGGAYFKAMRRFDLRAIQAGAEVWVQQGKRFPKPAEWIDSIPRKSAPIELPTLSDEAARVYVRAEGLRYEDAPCHCRDCEAAGVTDQPLRFVPEYTSDGRDRKALLGDRIVTTGHWAHGDELKRWYAAKNKFWADMFALFGADGPKAKQRIKLTYEQRMKQIFEEPVRLDAKKSDLEPLA